MTKSKSYEAALLGSVIAEPIFVDGRDVRISPLDLPTGAFYRHHQINLCLDRFALPKTLEPQVIAIGEKLEDNTRDKWKKAAYIVARLNGYKIQLSRLGPDHRTRQRFIFKAVRGAFNVGIVLEREDMRKELLAVLDSFNLERAYYIEIQKLCSQTKKLFPGWSPRVFYAVVTYAVLKDTGNHRSQEEIAKRFGVHMYSLRNRYYDYLQQRDNF